MAERTDRDAPQASITAEEMAMLTGGTEESEAKHKLKNVERVCAVCGKTYMGYSGRSKYCSEECREAAKAACNRRQYEERKKPKPEKEASRTKTEMSARAAEEARRKEAMAHLGELTREAHEAGLSYGQYMAQKRMAKGVIEHG